MAWCSACLVKSTVPKQTCASISHKALHASTKASMIPFNTLSSIQIHSIEYRFVYAKEIGSIRVAPYRHFHSNFHCIRHFFWRQRNRADPDPEHNRAFIRLFIHADQHLERTDCRRECHTEQRDQRLHLQCE